MRHRGEIGPVLRGQPAHRAADHGPGGSAEQESALGQAVAGADGVRLFDEHDLVHVGLVEQRRSDARAEAGDHPAAGRAAEGHRADAVHRDHADGPVPLPEVARAAHQGSGGARSDEQHVQLAGTDGRSPVPSCGSGPAN